MNERLRKMVSVLLLTAVLCVLPGTMAWASETGDGSGSTDVSAITPDAPIGDQNGGESGGTTPAGSVPGGSGDSGNTTGGTEGTGDTGSGSTDGTITPDTPINQGASEPDGSTVIVVEPGDAVTPEASATPTPTPTATPTPTPTPTATPAPTPALPTVTKHPTDETVDVGGECWFIANYSNALYAAWHFVSPDGKTDYRYDDQAVATAFPGLKIENGMYSNLHLSSIPAEMNGWHAYCEYRNNNGSTRTNHAVVHVNGAPAATPTPTPSPSATPTATPTPTPTPAATAAAAPSPETTLSPEESPNPEVSGEPAAALNRGGKIFLLFGAAAVAVGAVAIGTILLVAKRGAEKEAYSYRSSSKRRK